MEADVTDTPQTRWRIELFGGLHTHHPQSAFSRFPTQKIAMLLAFLACYPQRRHTREFLTDLLWPDARPTAGRDSLSQALVWLRRQLEPEGVLRGSILVADRLQVGLNPSALTTDVAEFDAAIQKALRTTAPEMRQEALVQAISLYKGDLLSDFHHDWIINERQRLHSASLLALRQLVHLCEVKYDLESALTAACLAATTPRVQAQTPEVTPSQPTAATDTAKYLNIGDPAPALQSAKWLKGAPVPQFEQGRLYFILTDENAGGQPQPGAYQMIGSIFATEQSLSPTSYRFGVGVLDEALRQWPKDYIYSMMKASVFFHQGDKAGALRLAKGALNEAEKSERKSPEAITLIKKYIAQYEAAK